MRIFHGESISFGIASGKIKLLKKNTAPVKRHTHNPQSEWGIFCDAKILAEKELSTRAKYASEIMDKATADIFNIHCIMINDEDYLSMIKSFIMEKSYSAEYAVYAAALELVHMLEATGNGYMALRGEDIRDVSGVIIKYINESQNDIIDTEEAVIIAADELMPGDVLKLKKEKILGFIIKKGSYNSHFAILARTMNIPVIAGVDIDDSFDEKMAVIDVFNNTVFIDPDEDIIKKAYNDILEMKKLQEQYDIFKEKSDFVFDDRQIRICANAGSVQDVRAALKSGADGIGLFRSEFVYLNKTDYPDEEEQFKIYTEVIEAAKGKSVVIRTLDTDCDKYAAYMSEFEGAFKKLRGIAFSLKFPHIFKIQLKALMRAAVFGDLRVMYPMVTSENEIDEIADIIKEAENELISEAKEYRTFSGGIMIENPEVVKNINRLINKTDFVSIGTNDLIRYTFNKDRSKAYTLTKHEAKKIIDIIKSVAQIAHLSGKSVCICGEMGADVSYLEKLLKAGVDMFSVVPPKVAELKYELSKIVNK